MSRKRTAPSLDPGDDAELNRSKRSRVIGHANGSADTDSVDDTDDERMSDATTEANGAAQHPEQQGEGEDGGSQASASDGEGTDGFVEHSEDQAIREEIRIQSLDARDHPSESGVIDEVTLKNFMCHKHLNMKLGQQLNFVIGHNGSGKSAILTGITIALGGKATSTSRGSSLKSFVREGADSAEVVLTMRNEGVEAFKPDLYGKKIIIERRILSQGGTSWKLKNDAGKVVSTKREEIDAYCDHTNIQVDNPMNVLSQDAARQFLSASAAKDKYAFFLKGTLLSQLVQEYERIRSGVEQMEATVGRHEDSLPDLDKDLRETMSRYRALDKARGQKAEMLKLEQQMVWSQVNAKEHEFEQQKVATETAKQLLDTINADIEAQEAALEVLDQEIEAIEDRARASRDREAPLREERARLAQQIRAQDQRAKKYKEDALQFNEQYTRLEQDMERLQKDIDAEAARLAPENRDRIQALRDEREESVRELEDLKVDESDLQRQLEAVNKETYPLRSQLEVIARELNSVQRTIADKESQLQTLQSSRSEKLMVYGPNIMHVLRAIENFRGWRTKPLGPIGRYVKLRDQKWAQVIESVLNRHLPGFVVSNWDDHAVLSRILSQHHMGYARIFVANDDEFDFSGGEPDASILTILRAIEVTEPIVLRVLINTATIEKAALVGKRVEGDRLFRQNPKNVYSAFSLDMFRIWGGDRGSSTSTVNYFRGAPRLATNMDDNIRRIREELQRAEGQKLVLDRRLADHRTLCSDKEAKKQDIKTKLPGIARKIRQLVSRISQIDDTLKEDAPTNVAALHENLQEMGRDKAKAAEDFKSAAAKANEADAANKSLVEMSDKIKAQIDAFADSRNPFQEQLEAKAPLRMETSDLLKHRRLAQEKARRVHQDKSFQLGQLEGLFKDWLAQAEEYCSRVEAPEPFAKYEQRHEALEKAIAQAKKRGVENIDDVLTGLRDKKRALTEAKTKIKEIRGLCKVFHDAMLRRREGWKALRGAIASRARLHFTMYLENRGYSGSLSFDHDNGTLRLQVQTEDSSKEERHKDPRALSGGEKSFSTICLLLALWEAIGCPIRCLDEFDVFMDAVNRKIAMQMVAETANKNQSKQFILITPQNMANVNFGSEVRILRMGDPERGQGTLQAGASG